jgi:hypothetical protein
VAGFPEKFLFFRLIVIQPEITINVFDKKDAFERTSGLPMNRIFAQEQHVEDARIQFEIHPATANLRYGKFRGFGP